jgi:biopolymer transport protein ExbB/TolQ
MPRNSDAFTTFHRWLVFFGLIAFGAVFSLSNGYFDTLLRADESHISALILVLLLLASLDAGRRAYRLGQQLDSTLQISAAVRGTENVFVVARDDQIAFADEMHGHSFAHDHLLLLANKTHRAGTLADQNMLLERLENVLGRGHETGWFLAELMIRLGLLGTVIGFIFMLGSVANVASIDVQALQQLLTSMSAGMRVALYTTLTGLGAGILLGFQYRLLDAGVDRLMAEIIELSEVHITGHLHRLISD